MSSHLWTPACTFKMSTIKYLSLLWVHDILVASKTEAYLMQIKTRLDSTCKRNELGKLSWFLEIQLNVKLILLKWINLHILRRYYQVQHGILQTILNSMWNGSNKNKWQSWFSWKQTLSWNYWQSKICNGCNKSRHLLYSYKVISRPNKTKFFPFNEGTINHSQILKKSQKPLKLEGFGDTDWADLSVRKSASRFCFRLAENNPMMLWKSKK